jgi:CHASE2 domain-containing sensor protein
MKNITRKKKYCFIFESFLATSFVFIVIWLLGMTVFNIKFFDPFEKAFGDFQYTDVLYSKISGQQKAPDTGIVLLSIDTLDRKEIAQLLESLCFFKPKVIGIDILFNKLKDPVTDSMLKDQLHKFPDLVTPMHIEEGRRRDVLSSLHPYFGKLKSGHVNFIANDPQLSTLRTFYPVFFSERDTFFSFAAEIVKLYNPVKYAKMNHSGKELVINYRGNNEMFLNISGSEALKDSAILNTVRDKIVLVGSYYPSRDAPYSIEDKYFTPLNPKISGRSVPDMYGIVIHANIISMILHEDYIYVVPKILEFIISFLACIAIMMLFMVMYHNYHPWFPPGAKAIQLLFAVILLFLVLWMHDTIRIKFNPVLLLAAIVLSAEILYFYHMIAKVLYDLTGLKSYLTKPHTT